MCLDNAKSRFSEVFHGTSFVPNPVTENEILEFEKRLSISFPAAYKEFLLWMGNGAGDFITHFVFHLRSLLNIQEFAEELVQEHSEILPNDALVIFWGSQGYYFIFVQVDEGDDPPIHIYSEGDGFTWGLHNNLQNFILDCIKWYETHPEISSKQK